MKFSTRTDIRAPQDRVFAAVTDFAHFERQAARAGAEVRRTDPHLSGGLGAAWHARFEFRGRPRELQAEAAEFDPDTAMRIDGATGGLDFAYRVEVLDLARERSRLFVSLDLTPRTLAARLLVQSFKLTKGTLDRRFSSRVAGFGEELERRYRDAPA